MNQRQLKMFRNLLKERRQKLLDEADRTVGGMATSEETFPDPTDRALLEGNRNLLLRIRDRERKLIAKIDEVIERIEDGSYGKCDSCGGPIGVERLKVRPETTHCIECKESQEAEESRPRPKK